MPDTLSDDLDLEHQDTPGDLRRRLEEANKRAAEAATRAAAAEREVAFARAGIDLTDPKMGYFARGYEGDISADAIKAAALEAGFLNAPAPAVDPAELAQHQQVANLAAGEGQVTHQGPLWMNNPEYEAEMARATSKDEVFAVMAKYGSPLDDGLD